MNTVEDDRNKTVLCEVSAERLAEMVQKLGAVADVALPPGVKYFIIAYCHDSVVKGCEDLDLDNYNALYKCVSNITVDRDKLIPLKQEVINSIETATGILDDEIGGPDAPTPDIEPDDTGNPPVVIDGNAPPRLEDEDPIPFGKHKGKKMKDVPVNYLHWFYHETTPNNMEGRQVHDYIYRNLVALKDENPDLIWKRKF